MPDKLTSMDQMDSQIPKQNLAVQLQKNGDLERAQTLYQDILTTDPTNHTVLHLSGVIEIHRRNYVRAITLIRDAIRIQPKSAQYYGSLGLALHENGQHREAIANFDWALLLNPDSFEVYYNCGNTYVAAGDFERAHLMYQEALKRNPQSVYTLYNCGISLQNLKQFRAAIQYYDAALAIQSNYPEALRNKALSLLYLGDYEQGFPLFENRWLRKDFVMPAITQGKPLWLGAESLTGKTILLHSEQGLGDSIQFCRYASLVANMGATVILEVDKPLVNLLATLQGVTAVYVKGASLPAFDYHCPLLSLPLAFKTKANTVPRTLRYLHSAPGKIEYWTQRLGPKSQIRIGIAWSGGESYSADSTRSIALSDFLAELPTCFQYVSLQKEVRETDLLALTQRPDILHFGSEQKDFSDTAAIIDLLDLVISVDTSVGHLSAALGKPTASLLSYLGDWRWIAGMDESPWYPNTKLFRQEKPNDWSAAFAKLRTALHGNFFKSKTP